MNDCPSAKGKNSKQRVQLSLGELVEWLTVLRAIPFKSKARVGRQIFLAP